MSDDEDVFPMCRMPLKTDQIKLGPLSLMVMAKSELDPETRGDRGRDNGLCKTPW